jgi:integrase
VLAHRLGVTVLGHEAAMCPTHARLALKPTTIADYTQSAEVYVIPRVGHVSLQQVTPEVLDHLYRDLERAGSKRGTPLSPKSVRNVHIMLHKALGDATARGHIARNPASLANPPSAKAARSKAAQQCWTREQTRVFLGSVADHRLYGLWRLLAATGLRRAEVPGCAGAISMAAH